MHVGGFPGSPFLLAERTHNSGPSPETPDRLAESVLGAVGILDASGRQGRVVSPFRDVDIISADSCTADDDNRLYKKERG